MRSPHDKLVFRPIGDRSKSPHVAVCHELERAMQMFVRAVWRVKRLRDTKQTLREIDVPSTRDAVLLGIGGPDFSKMTQSLFDR